MLEAARLCRLALVEGDHVLVDHDAGLDQPIFRLLTGDFRIGGSKVEQHEMIVRAAGDQPVAALNQPLGQGLGVVEDLLLVGLELGLKRFLKRHRFGRDGRAERIGRSALPIDPASIPQL